MKTVIGRRFHLSSYTVQGVRKLLVRNGWSCQVPARRAMERDDDAVAGWVKEVWPRAEGWRRPVEPGWSSRTKPASSMTPSHARTWSRRGRTPVVRVRGRSRRRISIAALTCYRPGNRSRLIYRPRRDDGRRDGRKSFSWRDYRDLLIAAHQQLGGPIVLIWDNLNVHKAAGLREIADSRDWLTILHLPPYAPDLNPVEGIWSLLRRGWLSNVALSTPEHLIRTIRSGLRHIQYRSNLIDGCLTETGLTIRSA